MAIPVRAKHVVMSNDQRRLMVLEGTPSKVISMDGSKLRPMLRVMFTSAIDIDALPLTAHGRLELVLAPEELVLDVFAGVPDAARRPGRMALGVCPLHQGLELGPWKQLEELAEHAGESTHG